MFVHKKIRKKGLCSETMTLWNQLILIQTITKYITPFEPDCNALGAKQEREREREREREPCIIL